jgi:nitrite reductase/ring-hydroxylating ferredoxin subunit
VACPWHGWTFDVRTGQPDHPGGHCVAAYQVKVRRSDIYVGWIKP